jgi:glycosyltransferase involved in cell wall biosynthesis
MSSNKVRKGTESVLRSVNQLKNAYAFDFKLIHNVPKSEAALILQQSDIVLDQFVIGDHGLLALESMASGKPTVCYIKPSILNKYPDDFPIVVANQDNLTEVLEALLKDSRRRNEIGRRSRAYVERYHDARKVARDLVCIYEELLRKKNTSRSPTK